MKLRKRILTASIIALMLGILSLSTSSYADDNNLVDETKYLGIEQYRNSGYSYQAHGKVMWKIFDYTSDTNGTKITNSPTYYCIKAGPGFGSRTQGSYTGGNSVRVYDYSRDLKDRSSIQSPYLDVIPSGNNYNSLIAILEKCYVPELDTDGSARVAYLAAAGLSGSKLTDDDIDVVQQLAIWYYTNNSEAPYNEQTFELALRKTTDTVDGYTPLSDRDVFGRDGEDRSDDAMALFTYLIGIGDANKQVAPTQANTQNPISINKNNATITLVRDNYILGPYTINQIVNNIEYGLGSSLTNGNTQVNYQIVDSNGNQVDLKSTVGNEFYITVDKNDYASGLVFSVVATTTEKNLVYWSVTPQVATVEGLSIDQPVVQIKNIETPYPAVTVTTPNIPEEKVFDLCLRKFITSVNGNVLLNTNGTALKAPVVDVTPLVNGTSTTAIYKHQKAPVSVAIGDEVIYTIRVYNEGQLDGYVTEITDYLPAGLEYVADSSLSGLYNYTVSTNGRNIKISLKTNKLLRAFENTMTEPDYVDVQIKCRVKNTNQLSTILTNIAEITGFTDKEGNTITDRDSQKSNATIPNDSNLPSYKGKDTNSNDLTKTDYFYKGQQDDDDFDKLILKEFDLALRKFIVSVNNRQLVDNNGKYIKEPVVDVSPLVNKTGTTAIYKHQKAPIGVAAGDEVIYTIRVYNEGEVDAYVTEITDYLPEQLEYVSDSTLSSLYNYTVSTNGRNVKISLKTNKLLRAFENTMTEPDHVDVQIKCKVKDIEDTSLVLTNIAEITNATDKNGNSLIDRDSQVHNVNLPTDSNLPNYKGKDTNSGNLSNRDYFFQGQQDDDDFDKLILKAFDLSLRKFVTAVNDNQLVDSSNKYIKEPVVDITPLLDGETTASYKHQKAPVGVAVGDEVIYTIRVYNEGEVDGYVTEITDHLPTYLQFINDEFNATYGWTVSSDGRTLKTTITSPNTTSSATQDALYADRRTEEDKVLLKAFNGESLDYIDVKVKCRVTEVENLDTVITNIADITGFTNSNGNVVTDRDSQQDNVVLPQTEQEWSDYKANSGKSILSDSNYYYKGQQDDDDFDKLVIKEFDLALRKFITALNETSITNRYPKFTLNLDSNGNYIYEHTKEPVLVATTDYVEYTIRIFNEGNIAGYASKVIDDIPDGLEFLPQEELNTEYRWKMLDENGEETQNASEAVSIVTDYLSKEQNKSAESNLLNAFDKDTMAVPDYRDVKALFKVVAPNSHEGIITNTAEIKDDTDENGNPIIDRDSTPGNNNKKEDDIDVEHIKLTYFDLALRKFITAVNETEVTNRIPEFKITEDGKYVYEHTKEPVEVENGNIVTYTLRVYNEGTKNGYASRIKDDLPEGLEFLPENNTNKEYRWVMLDENGEETQDVSKAVSVVTDYLSKEQEKTSKANLLYAFDQNTMTEPDHKDVKIAFKVTEPNTSDRILINKAQIADDTDENGNPVVDKDSTPDKWIENEDDQDIEKVKVKYFDLALRKWVTQAIVIENGKEKVTNTGHKAEDDPEQVVKVEIQKSKINKVVVKFKYSIRITNQGEIAGYAKEISDYIPEGLKFVQADNPDWKEKDGKIVTEKLADKLLQPGESAEVEVLLTWKNGSNNMGLKVNVAEISKDYNESNTPDIDSTPNNKVEKEDDIDDAPVILATKTGELVNSEYIALFAGVFVIITSGIILIKKFILK